MRLLKQIRFFIFIVSLSIFFCLQLILPRRKFMKSRWQYSLNNLALLSLNNLMLILIVIIPLKAAIFSEDNNMGLLYLLELSPIVSSVVAITILDVTIYFQHVLFHKIDFLWKLHSVHHMDPMLDSTTGFRFHPLEILISNFIKVALILLIGARPIDVLIFEIILSTTAIFNHSNLKINSKLEKILRLFLITPDLHLIHHSTTRSEMNSNYGFSVCWWDRIFKTFTRNPKLDYPVMILGIRNTPKPKYFFIPYIYIFPFKKN